MFTETTFINPNWLQQKDHESSINTRLVLVNFSFASRSSLVRYSLVYRRPIENRTRIYLRTKDEREVIEDTTKKVKPDENGRLQFPDSFWLCQTNSKRPRNAFNNLLSKGCQLQQPDPEWHQAVHG